MVRTEIHIPTVSVVVPIYKVEKYLRLCVDSILAQTLRDIEVILVDDGSPDSCPSIVDEYAAQDDRVVVIHQENGGYGKAVNAGLDVARGKYVAIVESDDWIESDMYEKLVKKANDTDADIVKCRYYLYDSTAPVHLQDKEELKVLSSAPKGAFSPMSWEPLWMIHASIWSCIYKSSLLKDIRVLESRSAAYQDGPFFVETLAKADSIAIVDEPLVHYRFEQGQASSSQQTGRRCLQAPITVSVARDVLSRLGKLEQIKEAFFYWAYGMCSNFCKNITPELMQEYCELYSKVFEPIKNDKSFAFKYFSSWQKDDVMWVLSGNCFPKSKWHKFIFMLKNGYFFNAFSRKIFKK